jgi:hypothetical protein
MAPRRCRSCKLVGPGTEIPVLARGSYWAEWHLCGRCWGLLVIGLRSQLQADDFNPYLQLKEMRLRDRGVRAAIGEGLRLVKGEAPALGPRELAVQEEQWLLLELQAIVREVEESARFAVPIDVWQSLHQRLGQLRAEVRALRQRYPGIDGPT